MVSLLKNELYPDLINVINDYLLPDKEEEKKKFDTVLTEIYSKYVTQDMLADNPDGMIKIVKQTFKQMGFKEVTDKYSCSGFFFDECNGKYGRIVLEYVKGKRDDHTSGNRFFVTIRNRPHYGSLRCDVQTDGREYEYFSCKRDLVDYVLGLSDRYNIVT
jgi:hypothetical protein